MEATKKIFRPIAALAMTLGIASCASIPPTAVAVSPFDKERYLGKWYEIARKDVIFERDMDNTYAEYSLNEDGTIKVYNSGYNTGKKKWSGITGKAKFIKDENTAMLKVSFFGPFYSGYNVLAIDENYEYALVAGKSHKYLWILSRRTSIPDDIKTRFLETAEKAGFDTSDLLWIGHDKNLQH
jgi:apolipoprotein D and lipocalin family protein